MLHTLLVVFAAAAQPVNLRTCQAAAVLVRVTDRAGAPLGAAHVKVLGRGAREVRETTSSAAGCAPFNALKAGTYMLRVERDEFITLEKEFTVAAGRPTVVAAALSPRAPAAAVAPGQSRVLSIPDLAERQLNAREPVKESPLGCSGSTEARLIQVREPLAPHAHGDADETLYVVAGEGTLKIGEEDRRISPGWFSMVPRGAAHSLTRKGKNPVIVVSVLSGQPCPPAAAIAAAAR